MHNSRDPQVQLTSALAQLGILVMVPVALLLLLPFLLFFIVILHALAFVYGAKILVSGGTSLHARTDHDLQEPHFIKVKVRESKALPDESSPPLP